MAKTINEISVDQVGNKTIEYSDGSTSFVPVDVIQMDNTTGQLQFAKKNGDTFKIDSNVNLDIHKKVISRGKVVCNWRDGTFTNGGGCGIEPLAFAPVDSAVAFVNGGAAGNFCTFSLPSDIPLASANTIGIWVRVAQRNTSYKDHRSALIKLLVGALAGWTNYAEFTFAAVADGQWHHYVLDTAKAVITGTWSWTTGVAGAFRIRASWDVAVSADPTLGCTPLQTGEIAYVSGITFNPKSKAAAMVRWDDNLASVVNKVYVLASDYVGTSGVTIPAGSYSGFDLCEAFGHKAAMFILTSTVGVSEHFLTVSQLQMLQNAGWEICFQTHNNPRDTAGRGGRLLGPAGFPWYAIQNLTHSTDGTITGTAHYLVDTFDGQTNHVTLVGTPPLPLLVGKHYWARYVSATSLKLFNSLEDSYTNTNPITFDNAGSASWGWNQFAATVDGDGASTDFSVGLNLMRRWGFNGTQYWAPNQGAFDVYLQEACYQNNIRGVFFTSAATDAFALGRTGQWTPTSSLGGANTLLPSIRGIHYAFATDSGQSEASTRSYVRDLCRKGAIGQNVHHSVLNYPLSLLAYLDELKLRQDRGEIDVVLPSRVCDYQDNVALSVY